MDIGQVLYAGSWGEVSPDTIGLGLGGRETAMIKLAEAWANEGHNVSCFTNTKEAKRYSTPQGGFHEYLPIDVTKAFLANRPWDAVVTWELPSIFKNEAIRENAGVKLCEMQVAHFPGKEMEYAEEYCDYVCALSEWHKGFLQHSGLEKEVVVLPNGVDLKRYPADFVAQKIEDYTNKSNPTFVYSSSPDRGLLNLLLGWEKLRKSFPHAKLFVCYGLKDYLERMRWNHNRIGEICVEIERLIDQPGVYNLEKIGQGHLARLQQEATAWLYPSDPLWPTETGCITAVENAAAGNPLVVWDSDCLESEFGKVGVVKELPFKSKDLVHAAEFVLDDRRYKKLATKGRKFAETRTWEKIGKQWLDLIENALY